MRALIVFDKFKDALSAAAACTTARDALRGCVPHCEIDLCPLTDGGEGFVDVLARAVATELVTVNVTGPRGDPVGATIGFIQLETLPLAARALLDLPVETTSAAQRGRLALIGMSSASGLALLAPERRDPWQTSSVGTGQLLRAARDAGASAILLGIGGSATNDLGTGALAELGLRFIDASGAAISALTPAHWSRVVEIQGRAENLPPSRIACDVTNPLTGPNGATAIYGPQKGLRAEDLPRMENEVRRIATLLTQHCHPANDCANLPGAGAAGGMAFGLATGCGARLVSGFELLCAWCDLDARIQAADIVITGEGHFDATSLRGKGPGAIASRAHELGKPVHVFAGRISVHSVAAGIAFHEITPVGTQLAHALQTTRENLVASIRRVFS